MDCVTPSNPIPIPPGETRTIYDAIAATKGQLSDVVPLLKEQDGRRYTGRRQQVPTDILWLEAQSAQSDRELQAIAREVHRRRLDRAAMEEKEDGVPAQEWWEKTSS